MLKYVIKRLLFGILTLLVIITITFFLMHSIPGSPFSSDGLESMSPQISARLMSEFGLDKPLGEQYILYMKNLASGKMGTSIMYSPQTVESTIKRELPISATLGLTSFFITCVLGIAWGMFAALNQGKWQDRTMKVLTTLGITIPSFVLATMAIYIFSFKLGWLPTRGFEGPKHLILPAATLSFGSIAYLSRLTRSSLLDVIRQDYVRTAKAKGLGRNKIIFKHAMKNALLPIVTYLGPLVAAMLLGSFVIERIFNIPGIGSEMVNAISNRDYTMILGLTAFYSMIMISVNLVVDLLYALIDPRIKY